MSRHRTNYEPDDVTFPAGAYRVSRWGSGIAFYVRGWETETRFSHSIVDDPCTDCHGTGTQDDAGETNDCENCHGLGTTPYECIDEEGDEVRTGRVVVTMIGDDARHTVDPDDLTPLERGAYCGECGQIGCSCDGYDRTEDNA